MTDWLEKVNGIVWGVPALLGILGVGAYLSVRTGFAQLRLLPMALKRFFGMLFRGNDVQEGITPVQALCTALAATVGTGNLVGVAGAICLGGPGAVFWMWIGGILGMGTKFCEAMLAVRYRQKRGNEYIGGPMYIISRGMGKKWQPLAAAYAIFGVIAAFGVGNATQINSVISGVNTVMGQFGVQKSLWLDLLLGAFLGVLTGVLLMGGGKRIARAAEKLVPIASAAYILLCIGALVVCRSRIPYVFTAILHGAFEPKAVTGGMLGSAFLALRIGCARGVFTNEAGLGTAAIAHAGAQVEHPGEQGLLGIVEVFLDTILICTMTALVILTSGVGIPYGIDAGGTLTTQAFASVYGDWVSVFIALALCCFAIATVLGWGLYGGRCAEFLFGSGCWKWFVLAQTLMVVIGAVMDTGAVWLAAETVNGLMAIPNLIALAYLSPEIERLTKDYKRKNAQRTTL